MYGVPVCTTRHVLSESLASAVCTVITPSLSTRERVTKAPVVPVLVCRCHNTTTISQGGEGNRKPGN